MDFPPTTIFSKRNWRTIYTNYYYHELKLSLNFVWSLFQCRENAREICKNTPKWLKCEFKIKN
jgi:hypothetical protein